MPPKIQGRFRGRKDGTTQNVLAAISFNLKFTYILAGWEGSAHDSHVLNDAFARPGDFQLLMVLYDYFTFLVYWFNKYCAFS